MLSAGRLFGGHTLRRMMMQRKRLVRRSVFAALMALLLVAGACSGGGDDGAEGTYEHPEEGTITLSDGGKGTWVQEGNDEPFEFEWQESGDTITFTSDGKEAGNVKLEDGDLVLPPDMISGDEDVTFTRQ